MKVIRVYRKDKNVDVIVSFDKTTNKYCFVNLTDNHICKCRFNTVEDAMNDIRQRKEVIGWEELSLSDS